MEIVLLPLLLVAGVIAFVYIKQRRQAEQAASPSSGRSGGPSGGSMLA